MTCHRAAALAVLTAAIALPPSRADAAVQPIRSEGTAVGSCQAALPAFEGLVRKRPLSVQNEGSSTAFVTCAMQSSNLATQAGIYFSSVDGQDHIINCTTVIGYQGTARFVTRQVIAAANGSQSSIVIAPADVGRPSDLGSSFVSWSCQLPAGTGINDLYNIWGQEIGS